MHQQHRKGRILLIGQDDSRLQFGYLAFEVSKVLIGSYEGLPYGRSSFNANSQISTHILPYKIDEIKPGMPLKEIRFLCEEKMRELGEDSFWYYDIGAFVFAGDETTVSVSG